LQEPTLQAALTQAAVAFGTTQTVPQALQLVGSVSVCASQPSLGSMLQSE
jgi:hypothetical protein